MYQLIALEFLQCHNHPKVARSLKRFTGLDFSKTPRLVISFIEKAGWKNATLRNRLEFQPAADASSTASVIVSVEKFLRAKFKDAKPTRELDSGMGEKTNAAPGESELHSGENKGQVAVNRSTGPSPRRRPTPTSKPVDRTERTNTHLHFNGADEAAAPAGRRHCLHPIGIRLESSRFFQTSKKKKQGKGEIFNKKNVT